MSSYDHGPTRSEERIISNINEAILEGLKEFPRPMTKQELIFYCWASGAVELHRFSYSDLRKKELHADFVDHCIGRYRALGFIGHMSIGKKEFYFSTDKDAKYIIGKSIGWLELST